MTVFDPDVLPAGRFTEDSEAMSKPAWTAVWGKPVEGLQAGIRLASSSQTVYVGQVVKVDLVVRNVSDHPIGIAYLPFNERYGWKVSASGGAATLVPARARDRGEREELSQALGLTIGPGQEVAIPRKSPELAIVETGGGHSNDPSLTVKPGSKIAIKAQPFLPVARGEEWLSRLYTGPLELTAEHGRSANGSGLITESVASPPADGTAIAWGKPVEGLQAGIRPLMGGRMPSFGNIATFGLVVRNLTDHPIDVTFYPVQKRFGWSVTTSNASDVMVFPGKPPAEFRNLPLGPAVSLRFEPGKEQALPLDDPTFMVAEPGYMTYPLQEAFVWPGKITVQAQPLEPVAKGEDSLRRLLTGKLELKVLPPMQNTVIPAAAQTVGVAAQAQNEQPGPSVAWGKALYGLQLGIAFSEDRPPHAVGDHLWLDLWVRNVGRSDRAVSYRTGSVYIDPPARISALGGERPVVKGGEGQIVAPHSATLRPGQSLLIGHPNFDTYPNVERIQQGIHVYPEIRASPGRYAIQQDFTVTLPPHPAREHSSQIVESLWTVPLRSGTLEFNLEEPAAQIAWGRVVDGLQSGIGLQGGTDRFSFGDIVRLHIYVRNVGKSEAKLTWLSNPDPLMPSAKGPEGKLVTVQRVWTTSFPGPNTIALKPGETQIVGSPNIEIVRERKSPSYPTGLLVARPGTYKLFVRRLSNYGLPHEIGALEASRRDLGEGHDPDIPSGELPIKIVER